MAAAISKKLYKYQRTDKRRAIVQSSLLLQQKPNIELQVTGVCMNIELQDHLFPKLLNVRNSLQRLWAMPACRPDHFFKPSVALVLHFNRAPKHRRLKVERNSLKTGVALNSAAA